MLPEIDGLAARPGDPRSLRYAAHHPVGARHDVRPDRGPGARGRRLPAQAVLAGRAGPAHRPGPVARGRTPVERCDADPRARRPGRRSGSPHGRGRRPRGRRHRGGVPAAGRHPRGRRARAHAATSSSTRSTGRTSARSSTGRSTSTSAVSGASSAIRPESPRFIATVRGAGYRLAPLPAASTAADSAVRERHDDPARLDPERRLPDRRRCVRRQRPRRRHRQPRRPRRRGRHVRPADDAARQQRGRRARDVRRVRSGSSWSSP